MVFYIIDKKSHQKYKIELPNLKFWNFSDLLVGLHRYIVVILKLISRIWISNITDLFLFGYGPESEFCNGHCVLYSAGMVIVFSIQREFCNGRCVLCLTAFNPCGLQYAGYLLVVWIEVQHLPTFHKPVILPTAVTPCKSAFDMTKASNNGWF